MCVCVGGGGGVLVLRHCFTASAMPSLPFFLYLGTILYSFIVSSWMPRDFLDIFVSHNAIFSSRKISYYYPFVLRLRF